MSCMIIPPHNLEGLEAKEDLENGFTECSMPATSLCMNLKKKTHTLDGSVKALKGEVKGCFCSLCSDWFIIRY